MSKDKDSSIDLKQLTVQEEPPVHDAAAIAESPKGSELPAERLARAREAKANRGSSGRNPPTFLLVGTTSNGDNDVLKVAKSRRSLVKWRIDNAGLVRRYYQGVIAFKARQVEI